MIKSGELEIQKIKVECPIHKQEYEAKYIKMLNIYSNCPLCMEQKHRQDEIAAAKEALIELEQENKRLDLFLKENSKMPLKFVNKQEIKMVGGFLQNSEFLEKPLNTNLFINGASGTGKTLFCCEVMKQNKKLYPLYININNYLFMSEHKILESLKDLENRRLVVLDEAHLFIQCKAKLQMAFNLIIDFLYNQNSFIILSGNFTSKDLNEFKSDYYTSIKRRLKDKGLIFVNLDI